MKFEYSEGLEIKNFKQVNVKKMNHILEVTSVLNNSNGFVDLKKLSKTEYMVVSTGEVLKYNLSENRAENVAGLKDTFKKIRDLINNNFVGAENEIHLTLTYKENMKDTEKLKRDFNNFWKRYKYNYGQDAEYLSVIEPQGRGAWHCHVLIKHPEKKKVFIPQKELAEMWGNGFIKIKAMDGVDNIGAYLSAYLGDVELTPENIGQAASSHSEIKVAKVDGIEKKFIKGGRLHMYPPGMNIYRHSKGIKPPEVQKMYYRQIKEIVGNSTPNYSKTVKIIDDQNDSKLLNCITYENYNIKRLKIEPRKE